MGDYIEYPVTIAKTDLPQHIVKNRFTLNRVAVMLEGELWEAGTIVFLGFAGNHIGNQQYAGAYRFREAQPKDSERDFFDPTRLPGWATEAAKLVTLADVTTIAELSKERNNGIHT